MSVVQLIYECCSKIATLCVMVAAVAYLPVATVLNCTRLLVARGCKVIGLLTSMRNRIGWLRRLSAAARALCSAFVTLCPSLRKLRPARDKLRLAVGKLRSAVRKVHPAYPYLLIRRSAITLKLPHFFSALAQIALLPVYLPVILVCCVISRVIKAKRLLRGELPRLVWGPYPSFSNVEISRALRPHGYVSDTIVYYSFERLWDPSVFTFCLDRMVKKVPYGLAWFLKRIVLHYVFFVYVMLRYDILHGFFYWGYLRDTIFERLEIRLLHLAGCKQINMTIGGDVAEMQRIDSHLIRQGMNDMYPELTSNREQASVRDRIRHFCAHSDFIICQCSYMIDALPRWDLLVTQYFPIDTDFWHSEGYFSDADGRDQAVRIGHSPNHRPLKGTNFLIRAVKQLRQEGLKIELVLLEKHLNRTVKEILSQVDIIVADLMLQGYAVMGVEGLSLGKPVLQDISDPHYNRVFKLYTGLDEAPFVSTTIENSKDNLRKLIVNPGLRREIGKKSREYVLKYHSYEANWRFWQWVYEYVWFHRRQRVAFYHPDWPISTLSSLNQVLLTKEQQALADRFEASLANNRKCLQKPAVAFYPLDEETYETVETLVDAGVIRSDDYLVRGEQGPIPPGVQKLPQAVIGLQELPDYGLRVICLLREGTELERALMEFSDGHPHYDVSVNDATCVTWPTDQSTLSRVYRRLTLAYRELVVPPFHYSNYTYINYLKRMITPGMRVMDAFAGPGTIGLSVAKECGLKEISLFDCSSEAVELSKMNAYENFNDDLVVKAYQSDLFDSVPKEESYDFIVGNPPHNLDEDRKNARLDRAVYVQSHDPDMAIHRQFFAQADQYLAPGGKICLLENGEQGCATIDHMRELLAQFPQYEILNWEWMAGSLFYAVTIGLRGARS